MSRAIDMRNAYSAREDVNNFTCLLFRLLAKSNAVNLAKLGLVYPIEVEMVCIYHDLDRIPLSDDPDRNGEVDWYAIEREATEVCLKKVASLQGVPSLEHLSALVEMIRDVLVSSEEMELHLPAQSVACSVVEIDQAACPDQQP